MTTLQPKPGFDWTRVNWGGPDQVRTDKCSYCDTPIPEDDVPLILWNEQSWCAEFCKACRRDWWGFVEFDDPPDDYFDDEPPLSPEQQVKDG